jgi:hypothetical protein
MEKARRDRVMRGGDERKRTSDEASKSNRRHQNQSLIGALGKAWRQPAYRLCGVRYTGGVTFIRALVWNLRTWPAMPTEKAQAALTARPKVPMRRIGADCLIVVTKRGNARGAKGAGHRRWAWGNRSCREAPGCSAEGGSVRTVVRLMMREYQVRTCEGIGVKFPGPTRRGSVLQAV